MADEENDFEDDDYGGDDLDGDDAEEDDAEGLDSAHPESDWRTGKANADRITTPYLTKYERARVLGTRALQIAMCAPVMVGRWEHAASLLSAGETAQLRGRLPEALALLKRSQRVYEAAGASGTTAHATCLTAIGSCYCRQGKYKDAEALLQLVFETLDNDEALTPGDGEFFKVYGRCRLGQGRGDEALAHLSRARRIFEDTHAIKSASFGELLLLLAATHLEGDRPEDEAQATASFEEAASTLEAIGGTGRAEYALLPLLQGRLQLRHHDAEQALASLQQAQAVMQQAGALETPEYGCLLLFMGKCRLRQGFSEAAMQLFAMSKEVYESADATDAMAHLMLVNL